MKIVKLLILYIKLLILAVTGGIVFVVFYGFIVVPIQTNACLRNGPLPENDAAIADEIASVVWTRYKTRLTTLEISPANLASSIAILSVEGRRMTFEHKSTRYITFSATLCSITFNDEVRAACGQPFEPFLNLDLCNVTP